MLLIDTDLLKSYLGETRMSDNSVQQMVYLTGSRKEGKPSTIVRR